MILPETMMQGGACSRRGVEGAAPYDSMVQLDMAYNILNTVPLLYGYNRILCGSWIDEVEQGGSKQGKSLPLCNRRLHSCARARPHALEVWKLVLHPYLQ